MKMKSLFRISMLCCAAIVVLATGSDSTAASDAGAQTQNDRADELGRLMTKGKLEADLGNHTAASETFKAIAEDSAAPDVLAWEALVRLGLSLSASDDALGAADTFRRVLRGYSGDAAAMRFLQKAVARTVPGKIWLDFRADFEELLRSGRLVSSENLGMPASRVRKVRLAHGEIELDAVWRPLDAIPPLREGTDGSFRNEAAAYELDRFLGLDMVPPTIMRSVEGREGAMTLWVYGGRSYGDVEGSAPDTPAWARQTSRMRTFDYLIGNRDRHKSNILVDRGWDLVLLDHTRSFLPGQAALPMLPPRFDGRLIDRLRGLNEADLLRRLGGLLDRQEIQAILERRDAILAHVDGLLAARGQSALF
jgi:hypothetical protein